MSVRALLRSNAEFNPINLPSTTRPQYVNDEGYEIEHPEVEHDGEDEIMTGNVADGGEEAETADQEEDIEMDDAEQQEITAEDEEHEGQIPLLSVKDSLVLPYSLTQTRHHHLTSLLPHIFSHPPVPSHSKPRARPPPKGTFLFPTPPPLVHPLPNPEYHGPIISAETSTPDRGESSKSPSLNDPSGASTPQPSAKKSRPKKSQNLDDVEWPAHEIECISRCTFSVGPISFPGTEIWIGRFVEPKITQPKKERARPGERKEKRRLLAEENAQKRARPRKSDISTDGGTPYRPRPKKLTPTVSAPSPLGNTGQPSPSTTGYVPRPPAYRPPIIPGPGLPPAVRPAPPQVRPIGQAPGPTPVRPTTASPQLIQVVNQAALRHAWLSTLIYKAAGSTANQTELERLGKAVARLSRGEPIEDLAPLSSTPAQDTGGPGPSTMSQSRPPPSTLPVANASAPKSAPAPAAPIQATKSAPVTQSTTSTSMQPSIQPSALPSTSSTAESQPQLTPVEQASQQKPEEPEDNDEVDMTGRPQVGGGPLPPDSDQSEPAAPQSAPIIDATTTAFTAPSASTEPVPVTASAQPSIISTVSSSSALPDPTIIPKPTQTPLPVPATTSIAPIGPSINTVPPPSTPQRELSFTATTRPPLIPPFAQPSPSPVISTPQRLPTSTPPPPPKPTYPLPPPFLLIAFKEQPTEKFLLPLGKGSFISRVGGDYVTGPRPATPEPEPVPESRKELNEVKPAVVPQNDAMTTVEDVAGTVNSPTPVALPIIPPMTEKPLRSRTRQSLGRHAKEAPIPTPTPPPKEPTPPLEAPTQAEVLEKPKPTSNLPPLPGQKPPPGTVLLSTIIPSGSSRWEKVDWDELKKTLPFDNPEFWDKEPTNPIVVKEEKKESVPSSTPQKQPTRDLRHPRSNSDFNKTNGEKSRTVPGKPSILNLAAENLLPPEGDVQPVTIKLLGISDEIWRKIQGVIEETDKHEIETMFKNEPKLLDGVDLETENDESQIHRDDPVNHRTFNQAQAQSASVIPENQVINPSLRPAKVPRRGLSSKILSLLHPTYLFRKKAHFTELLRRVPPRSFLHTRVAPPAPIEIVEAISDKWAPKIYPITTKPLYLPNGEDDGEDNLPREIEFSPPPDHGNTNKKKKGGEESRVTFEVPVSYDLLDEKVEQGVLRNVLNARGRGRGRGRGGRIASSIDRNNTDEQGNPKQKKKKTKRGVQSGICEGCGKEGIKVWRRGPTGRGTLCNPCGDLFVANKLPPLQKPGAMKALLGDLDEEEGEGEGKEGDEGKEEAEGKEDENESNHEEGNDTVVQSPKVSEEASTEEVQETRNEGEDQPVNNDKPRISPATSLDQRPSKMTSSTNVNSENMINTSTTPITEIVTAPVSSSISETVVPTTEQGDPALTENPIVIGTSVGGFKEQDTDRSGSGISPLPRENSGEVNKNEVNEEDKMEVDL